MVLQRGELSVVSFQFAYVSILLFFLTLFLVDSQSHIIDYTERNNSYFKPSRGLLLSPSRMKLKLKRIIVNYWTKTKANQFSRIDFSNSTFFPSVFNLKQVSESFVCIHFWWKICSCEGKEKNTTSTSQNQLQFASRGIRKHWNLSPDRRILENGRN